MKVKIIGMIMLLGLSARADIAVQWSLQVNQNTVRLTAIDQFFRDGNWYCTINAAEKVTDSQGRNPILAREIACVDLTGIRKSVATYCSPEKSFNQSDMLEINTHTYSLGCAGPIR